MSSVARLGFRAVQLSCASWTRTGPPPACDSGEDDYLSVQAFVLRALGAAAGLLALSVVVACVA
jgi:hypothetical protein